MFVGGIVLIIIGIIGRLFASVTHITDTTAKAMGWTALNKIVGFLSWFMLVIGGMLVFLAIMSGAV
ncbi:MAG: hypothetical protein K6A42_03945 [Treponema sp.]|nr:hypothetical protein [Treponema sp.]